MRSAIVIIFRRCLWQYACRSPTRAIDPSSFITSQITPAGCSPAIRARSTEASVCPVRSRTPPARALSGLTWPPHDDVVLALGRVDRGADRVRAVGRADAGGHALARLDGHGERRLVRRLVLQRHELEAELVAALRREREADPAARVGGHEVDVVGRDELGGHDEVALVLAVLVVDDDDHPAGGDLLERLLDGRELGGGGGAHRQVRAPNSFSTYLARRSTSRLTTVPGAAAAQARALQGLGDQGHGEARVVDGDDGQRDAVDGDRPLLDDVAQHVRVGLDRHDAGEAVLAGAGDDADAVDVALDDVAAQPARRRAARARG